MDKKTGRSKTPKKKITKKGGVKSSPRSKPKGKYRSTFEAKVGEVLKDTGFEHEPKDKKLKYTIPESYHTYLPDFVKDNIIVEAKGRFDAESRRKMKLLRDQHPDKRIIMVFQNPNVPIRKGSKTKYWQWAQKVGIEWCTIDNLQETLNTPHSK